MKELLVLYVTNKTIKCWAQFPAKRKQVIKTYWYLKYSIQKKKVKFCDPFYLISVVRELGSVFKITRSSIIKVNIMTQQLFNEPKTLPKSSTCYSDFSICPAVFRSAVGAVLKTMCSVSLWMYFHFLELKIRLLIKVLIVCTDPMF